MSSSYLILDIPLPQDCAFCPMRLDCVAYEKYINEVSGKPHPKSEECLIKGDIQLDLVKQVKG